LIPKAVPPLKVARLVLRAAESKHPKYLYTINTSLSIRLLSWLPGKLFNGMLKWKLGSKRD
jgi:hypothetical protein